MANGIKISGDRAFMKALQSREPNAFLKYALKKTYNIDVRDKGSAKSPMGVTRFAIEAAGRRRHKTRPRKSKSPFVRQDVWVSDKDAIRLIKNPKVKKTASFGGTCKTLFVRIKNLSSRLLPKKKASKKRRRPPTRWWRWIPHSPIWYTTKNRKANQRWPRW